jgi:hypothetical protein
MPLNHIDGVKVYLNLLTSALTEDKRYWIGELLSPRDSLDLPL